MMSLTFGLFTQVSGSGPLGPLVSDAISCLLHNLKTIWNILMTHFSYVEQVMTMCPIQEEQVMTMCRIQEWQLSLSYFLSYFTLIISVTVSCPLCNLNIL